MYVSFCTHPDRALQNSRVAKTVYQRILCSGIFMIKVVKCSDVIAVVAEVVEGGLTFPSFV